MYEPPSVVPSHDTTPEPELIAGILQRLASVSQADLLTFVPTQVLQATA